MLSWFKRKSADASASCTVQFGSSGLRLRVARDNVLLAATLEQGLAYPHNCRVGTCGACKTRLVSGKIKPMMDFSLSPLTAQELRDGYVLACQSRVRSDLVIEVAMASGSPAHPMATRHAVVLSADRLAGDVMALRLRLDEPLHFASGQFADLAIEGMDVTRSYSFCDRPLPEGNTDVSFLIKRLPGGRFSEHLFAKASEGLAMRLTGPYGAMGAVAANADADALCIAGGTGLAPMLSILRDRLHRSASSRFTLLFGVRSLQEHFADSLLAQLEREAKGRLRIQVVLSDEPTDSAWPGARGLVTELITHASVQALPARAAFVCGAQPMVQAARQCLLTLGLPSEAIHADGFSPSGAPGAGSPPAQPLPLAPLIPSTTFP